MNPANLCRSAGRCRPWRERLAPAAAAVLCALLPAQGDVFDDFNDGNDTLNPTWTHSDIGVGGVQTYDASAFNYHLNATVGPFGVSYLGSFVDPAADCRISFDLLDWGGGQQKFGIYARATGINTFLGVSGYHFSYQPDNGQVLIRRMINANQAGQNLASTTYLLDANKDYRFVFDCSGSNLSGQIYEIGGPPTPVVDLHATDTFFTSGLSGVLGFGVGVPTDFTIDDFSLVIPEPATSMLWLLGGTALGVRWLRRRAPRWS